MRYTLIYLQVDITFFSRKAINNYSGFKAVLTVKYMFTALQLIASAVWDDGCHGILFSINILVMDIIKYKLVLLHFDKSVIYKNQIKSDIAYHLHLKVSFLCNTDR